MYVMFKDLLLLIIHPSITTHHLFLHYFLSFSIFIFSSEKTKVLLSNAEVLACIEAQRPPKKTKNSRPLGQFPFIQSHVRSYLRTTPALHEKEEKYTFSLLSSIC